PTSNTQTSARPCSGLLSGANSSGASRSAPSIRRGTPAGSSRTRVPSTTRLHAHNGSADASQAGCQPATSARSSNRTASKPPASHSKASPSQGTHNRKLPSKASGTTRTLIQGTASRFANGPLRLTGRPSVSIAGNNPSAMAHCAYSNAPHHEGTPSRPRKIQISNATATNDNQKP